MGRESSRWPVHTTTPFHEPESATVLDFNVDGPRDFAPERASGTNVYEAVAEHLAKLQQRAASRSSPAIRIGARERLSGLLADHGLRRSCRWPKAGRRRRALAAKGASR
jgi:transcription-repair coupling factor (superfamily II helicase)